MAAWLATKRTGGKPGGVRRLGIASALVLGITSGAMAALLLPEPTTAGIVPGTHISYYTYADSNCSVLKDPVNVVFVDWGQWPNVESHARLESHGDWWNDSGGDQYLVDHGVCRLRDQQSASADFTRYHMRYWTGTVAGSWEDTTLGHFSAAAAHFENWVIGSGCGILGGHAVPCDGFNRAREDIYGNWVRDGPHFLFEQQYWGNTHPIRQCNGQYALSNGYVYLITTERCPDFNGDRSLDVLDGQEIAYRYGAYFGNELYDQKYDLEPEFHDWDIDIKDLQKVFGRLGHTCTTMPPLY